MLSFSKTRDNIAMRVFNASSSTVEQAILENQTIPETSLNELTSDLAALLGIGKTETVGLLGVSLSRKTRNPTVNVDILDRTFVMIEMFARVSSILGEDAARHWFLNPKRAFDGVRPMDLLRTRVGLNRLSEVLTALEDGAYL